MKVYILFLMVCFTFFLSANASEINGIEKKSLYSGGMLILQPSYVIMQNPDYKITARGGGIGGILRYYIGSKLAAGIYGGRQNANYKTDDSENSYISLTHGGVFLGVTHKSGKFRYNASMGIGRGNINNLHITNQDGNELNEAYFYDYGTMVYVPFVSADYEITQRLLLTVQTSYYFADNMNYQSPVIQIGLLFNR